MEKEAHLEGHLLISIGMMLTMLHEDRFIVPILKRVGEREERREVYEGREVRGVERKREERSGLQWRGGEEEWFSRDREGERRKERGVVYEVWWWWVGKRSGVQRTEG